MDFWEWIKSHPYLAGGSALALLVLFIVWRNRSSSAAAPAVSASGQSDALTALQIQAGAQTDLAQIASNTQIAGYNAAVNATAQTSALQLATAQLQSNVDLNAIAAQSGVTNYQTTAGLILGLAQLGQLPSLGLGTGSGVGGPGAGTPTTVSSAGPAVSPTAPTSTTIAPIFAGITSPATLGTTYEANLKTCAPGDNACIDANNSLESSYFQAQAALGIPNGYPGGPTISQIIGPVTFGPNNVPIPAAGDIIQSGVV